MNDKELADKIEAYGVDVSFIDRIDKDPGSTMNEIIPNPYKFVRDWRVAGACLRNWPTTINTKHLEMTLDEMLRDPRAIIEAYVEAI